LGATALAGEAGFLDASRPASAATWPWAIVEADSKPVTAIAIRSKVGFKADAEAGADAGIRASAALVPENSIITDPPF
jgi:hypothetical protein